MPKAGRMLPKHPLDCPIEVLRDDSEFHNISIESRVAMYYARLRPMPPLEPVPCRRDRRGQWVPLPVPEVS